jgi:hypothetical protein
MRMTGEAWAGQPHVHLTRCNAVDPMRRVEPDVDQDGYVFGPIVAASRPHTDYKPHGVPRHDDMKDPLEDARILWQR